MENNTPPSSQTWLGFNEVIGTYNMPREWWIEFFKGHPGAEKFQTQLLYFEEECEILFGAVAAKGDDSWVPTSSSSARGKRSNGFVGKLTNWCAVFHLWEPSIVPLGAV
ncbi:hypothetical protein QJS10_CPB13g01256 [Acorus calamus]|uniref:Uncharacterized protein n=1 Tax=Acorus calamus TaxID=4465 RepID=A0AAV9DFE2_ACOCL|nr:hypothetical protein QJS10_CPB13g01256 [Acorus calamus]